MSSYLIADSGGTRTDWCFINKNKECNYFETESYHNTNWSDDFFIRIAEYWRHHDAMKASRLLFYGAGCMNESNALKQELIFKEIGFSDVIVRSDLHAAGIACLGKREGKVAIMGTGSVLFDWKDESVHNVIGGKGHLLGDEGSGYYFGKLVHNAYLTKQLSKEQNQLYKELVDLSLLQNNLKSGLSQSSYLLRNHKHVFEAFHRKNTKAFYTKHIKHSNAIDINLLGGYAFHHATIIEQELQQYKVRIKEVLNGAISKIVEQIATLND